jgi:hypothetical protein
VPEGRDVRFIFPEKRKEQTMKSRIPWTPNKKQEQAMLEEINRQIVARDKILYHDIVAMVLYALHVHEGTRFGVKRLRNFFTDFDKIHQDLLKRYELNNDETPWIVHRMLQEIGVNVAEWIDSGGDSQ